MHVTFAAGMTMPGTFVSGQDADAGSAILRTNVAFKAFIISNSIAMVLSTISALLQTYSYSCQCGLTNRYSPCSGGTLFCWPLT